MLIPCRIDIVTTNSDVRHLYAIYCCSDFDKVVQYVGVAPLQSVFTMEDAYANSKFAEVFGGPNVMLQITIESVTTDERDAYNEQRRLIAKHQPYCNLRGYYVSPKHQLIKCDQTGETFRTIQEAAQVHNLSYSQLNNHVNRKAGYRTVKGRTYSRVPYHTPDTPTGPSDNR